VPQSTLPGSKGRYPHKTEVQLFSPPDNFPMICKGSFYCTHPKDYIFGPDGLSQWPKALGDESSMEETSEEVEEWLDEVLGCMIWNEKDLAQISVGTASTHLALTTNAIPLKIPSDDTSHQCENELLIIRTLSYYLRVLCTMHI
jgi:hypothetical protein